MGVWSDTGQALFPTVSHHRNLTQDLKIRVDLSCVCCGQTVSSVSIDHSRECYDIIAFSKFYHTPFWMQHVGHTHKNVDDILIQTAILVKIINTLGEVVI